MKALGEKDITDKDLAKEKTTPSKGTLISINDAGLNDQQIASIKKALDMVILSLPPHCCAVVSAKNYGSKGAGFIVDGDAIRQHKCDTGRENSSIS